MDIHVKRQKITLPIKGIPKDELLALLKDARKNDADWHGGKLWGLVYFGGDEHNDFLKQVYSLYFSENALSPMAFPSLRKFETEVVAMSADLLGGDRKVVGTLTSGGTESILMAMKAYRDQARAKSLEKITPEIIAPMTAHPAFEKAAHYFDLKIVHVPVDSESFRADLTAVREAISPTTVAIVGSAPCFPYGVVDPIAELAGIAEENQIGCHVDACLGGFLLPFMRKLGHPVPEFDFSVPGVTSISADLHKYGFAAKGASVVLYRMKKLRNHQFYTYSEWPGGLYGSPSILGTKSGGPIAAAWAAMNVQGEEGYLERARVIMETTRKLMQGIQAIPELHILGKPDMSVFAFGSEEINVYALGNLMERRGWHLSYLQNPACLHMLVNPHQEAFAEAFLQHLNEAVKEVRASPSQAAEGMGAMYGMMAKIPNKESVNEFILRFLSDQYKL